MRFPALDDLVLLMLPALAVLLTWWHHARVKRGNVPALRPLAGLTALETRLGEGVEAGRPVHVATGAGQPGTIGVTAESIASLTIAERLADVATRRGSHVAATSGDAVNHAAVRGTLHRVYRETGLAADYRSAQAQLVAHQTPIAYAAGVVGRYASEPMDTSVVVGDGGAEVLLITEEGAQRRMPQVAGATSLAALPVLALSANATLVGEELFAAEAYLSEAAAPKARLLTQDALRFIVVLLIIAGIVYGLLNTSLGLGLPAL